jgi:probable lipoprotein NlpC
VGIYAGEGRFIHAASEGPKTGVIYSALDEDYWQRTYVGAGRFLPEEPAEEPAEKPAPSDFIEADKSGAGKNGAREGGPPDRRAPAGDRRYTGGT